MKKYINYFISIFILSFGLFHFAFCATNAELNNYRNYLQQGANALKVTKNYNEAIVNFEKALKINPNDYNTLCALAISYGYIGNNTKAEEILLTAKRKFPNEWLAYTFLGDIKLYKNQRQAGIQYYKKAISLPSMPEDYRIKYKQMMEKMQ